MQAVPRPAIGLMLALLLDQKLDELTQLIESLDKGDTMFSKGQEVSFRYGTHGTFTGTISGVTEVSREDEDGKKYKVARYRIGDVVQESSGNDFADMVIDEDEVDNWQMTAA